MRSIENVATLSLLGNTDDSEKSEEMEEPALCLRLEEPEGFEIFNVLISLHV